VPSWNVSRFLPGPSARRRGLRVSGLALLVLPSSALAAVHTVRPPESISAVLARAQPGDTVRLAPGEYRERVVIDVPVRLVGDAAARILGGYEGTVVHVTAPGTVLEGLEIVESGPDLTQDMAGVLVEADGVTVRGCSIRESLHGIYVKGGNDTRIVGNRVEGRLDLIESDRGNGIHLWNSRRNRVVGNEIFHARDGIYFSFANETEIERNHIHHVRYGLHYMYSNDNTFADNLFEHNVAGAALMYSENITFERNTFARCRGFRAYGILLQSMNDVISRQNLILDNSRGIFMNNTDGSVFERNDVVDNDLAIQLNGGCDDNRFAGNNFIGNLTELLLDVSDLETQWADEEGGNYWSHYRGYDLDRDGIGDVPFSIQNVFQVLESDVPEVRFYLLSPAAELLKAAEDALPILRLGDAQDPAPRMQPLANEGVPWERAQRTGLEPSPLWAGVYLAGTFLPLALLAALGRPRRPVIPRSSVPGRATRNPPSTVDPSPGASAERAQDDKEKEIPHASAPQRARDDATAPSVHRIPRATASKEPEE
jgi:nitrous oxidase accessory protein